MWKHERMLWTRKNYRRGDELLEKCCLSIAREITNSLFPAAICVVHGLLCLAITHKTQEASLIKIATAACTSRVRFGVC